MNRNLQAFGIASSQHEVVFSDQLIPVQEFRTELDQVVVHGGVDKLLTHLTNGGNVTLFDKDTWWDIVDELKSYLGSKASNLCGDSISDQESAMVGAETWVEDNISCGPRAKIVATAVVLYGYAKAEAMIRGLSTAVAA
ncbi:hypothetical protein [Burkholderia cepacia]|uniref:hypothetical protein n=1 Tax=Burkholderia cepacia TaxID=292 RepID=UPI002AB73D9E|nr:hypothetical protein [Burkholderia cepacia]